MKNSKFKFIIIFIFGLSSSTGFGENEDKKRLINILRVQSTQLLMLYNNICSIENIKNLHSLLGSSLNNVEIDQIKLKIASHQIVIQKLKEKNKLCQTKFLGNTKPINKL